MKDGSGASAWRKVEGEEGLVDSTHGAAAGWEEVHGVRIVGSGPRGKTPDREAIGTGDHRQSLDPLWKGDEWCRESSDGPERGGVKRPWGDGRSDLWLWTPQRLRVEYPRRVDLEKKERKKGGKSNGRWRSRRG